MRQSGKTSTLAMLAGLLPLATAAPLALFPAQAQDQSARPTVRVSPVILAEPEVETPIAVQIGPDTAVPRQSFLRIRGLPVTAKLSDGHVITPGAWAVPLSALPSLKVMAPLAGSGRTELTLSLVTVDGGVLAETKASLVVAPAWLLGSAAPRQETQKTVPAKRPDPEPVAQAAAPSVATAVSVSTQPSADVAQPPPAPVVAPPQPAAVVAPPPPPAPTVVAALPPPPAPPRPQPQSALPAIASLQPAPPAPPEPRAAAMSAEDKARAENMIQRGDVYLSQGNFAAARQFFRRAADIGHALGALRLAATYDPVELAAMPVQGLQADSKEARTWYERARELGSPEAVSRISRLEGR